MKRIRSLFSRKKVCMPLTNVQGVHVKKYHAFKSFLNHNHAALKAIAEMEQIYYSGRPFAPESVRIKYEELLEAVTGAVSSFESLARRELPRLRDTLREIDHAVSGDIITVCESGERTLVLPFGKITPAERKLVGSKAANLALIGNGLHLPAPDGFAVTAYAFERFMEENHRLGGGHSLHRPDSDDTVEGGRKGLDIGPLKALWKGFTHPGINWEGTVTLDAKNIMTLFAAGATSEWGYLNGELLIGYASEKAVKGFIGLWTKADSTTYFDEFTVTAGERKEVIEF